MQQRDAAKMPLPRGFGRKDGTCVVVGSVTDRCGYAPSPTPSIYRLCGRNDRYATFLAVCSRLPRIRKAHRRVESVVEPEIDGIGRRRNDRRNVAPLFAVERAE